VLGARAQVDIEGRVARDNLESLCRLTIQPVMAGMLFSLLVGATLWPDLKGPVFLSWVLVRVAISVARVWDCRNYLASDRSIDLIASRRRRFLTLMCLECASWSAMGLLFTEAVSPYIALVMLTGIVAVACVSLFSLGTDATAGGLFVTVVLLPNAAAQLVKGSNESLTMGGGMLVLLTVLLLEARGLASRLTELMRLRYENALIAEQRQSALRVAEHSSQAKSRFLATVSHEIRTPLNGILGMAQLLQREVDEPQRRARVDIVAQSARHLQKLIGDLLDLSRIDAGRLRLEPRPVNLVDMVHEVTELQAAIAREKGLGFSVHLAAALPAWFVADLPRVKQVLHNLLGNAIKFTEHGEVTLTVALEDRGDGRWLCFVVRDTGGGVPPALAERIFQPFEHIVPVRPSEGPLSVGGLGLGLAISRQLAAAMDGEVDCLAVTGRGACFRFGMPCRVADPPSIDSRPHSEATAPLRGHVLVAEDNPVNAMITQAMLERLGLSTELVSDGQAAVDALEQGRVDAVLMDCQMPGMDGWRATQEWRKRERGSGRQRVPIIALTANAVVGDRERCLQAGMDDYLSKPIELAHLEQAMRRHLLPSSVV
jgi:signal transduction histidine kinase/CheY-like chemotaxis protein